MTVARAASARRRVLFAAVAAVLFMLALFTQLAAAPDPPPPVSLAAQLADGSWAMTVPAAWLAAPVPAVRRGDLLDILAVKQGDRAYASPVAFAVVVVSSDERSLVIQVNEDDASAIALARGGGLLLVPLLRSTR
ncbi:MAG TPA: hypothetical protein VI814_13165 [Candidatus Limnocylindria bacterium]